MERLSVQRSRITPACAGSTLNFLHYPTSLWDHPRLRGEYKKTSARPGNPVGSPPLARGVRIASAIQIAGDRITPACAGSTPFSLQRLRANWDHPRLRGEYWSHRQSGSWTGGSPPLARGVRGGKRMPSYRDRITPACAGSTIECR